MNKQQQELKKSVDDMKKRMNRKISTKESMDIIGRGMIIESDGIGHKMIAVPDGDSYKFYKVERTG